MVSLAGSMALVLINNGVYLIFRFALIQGLFVLSTPSGPVRLGVPVQLCHGPSPLVDHPTRDDNNFILTSCLGVFIEHVLVSKKAPG
jgi:hypothetical protein